MVRFRANVTGSASEERTPTLVSQAKAAKISSSKLAPGHVEICSGAITDHGINDH
jgi:hypothetical protein